VRVVKEEVFAAWTDAMKQANEVGKAAGAEKDKEKRKQLLQQKKELMEKAKGVVRQAALEQAGVRQFAKTDDAARAK
jgi:cytochrome c oxidase subunit 2